MKPKHEKVKIIIQMEQNETQQKRNIKYMPTIYKTKK